MTSIGSAFAPTTTESSNNVNSAFNQSAETYLQLFLTQIQNQDPTEPVDTAELTASLSQLTNSQQLIEVNDSINKLVEIQNNTNASSITNMIDKKVQYNDDEFYYNPEYETQFSYIMDSDYVSGQVNILDSDGDIIYSSTVDGSQGTKEFKWQGKDKNGNQVSEGEYSVLVYGIDADKDSVIQKTLMEAAVTGVDFTAGGEPIIKLSTGLKDKSVGLSEIASISSFSDYKIISDEENVN